MLFESAVLKKVRLRVRVNRSLIKRKFNIASLLRTVEYRYKADKILKIIESSFRVNSTIN